MNNTAQVESLISLNNDIRENMRKRQILSENYTYGDYVFETYGHETPIVTFTDRLLSRYFIEYAMKETSVGVVRDINPVLSLSGAVKTNINNFSGTDTPTGLIANQLHAAALYQGAIFNTNRRDKHIQTGHWISRGTDSIYGNTYTNLSRLGSMFTIDPETGRVAGDDNLSENTDNITFEKIEEGVYGKTDRNFNTYYVGTLMNDYANFYRPETPYFDIYSIGQYSLDLKLDTSGLNFNENTNEEGLSFYNKPHTLYYYQEESKNGSVLSDYSDDKQTFNQYKPIVNKDSVSLLEKTNNLFSEHLMRTMIARFYEDTDTNLEFTDTAKTNKYGNSHGRNLLRKNGPKNINGYDNPYCRTWTFHQQYDRLSRLIRPFSDDDDELLTIAEVQGLSHGFRSGVCGAEANGYVSGDRYLAENTVLDNNGFVNIVRREIGQDENGTKYKNCMFSIENLAWKDVPNVRKNGSNEQYALHKSQRGDNGGRIMWFPPYGLTFSESVNARWEEYNFIGRGEPMYTYSNTTRIGNLSFYLLVDHPNIINHIYKTDANGNKILGYVKDKTKDEDGKTEKINKREITDEDILRFFAGCSPIDLYEPKPKEKPKEKPKPIPTPEYDTYTVYLFFPNNYSGYMNDNNGKSLDEDFEDYILGGVNVYVPEDVKEYHGYEIIKDGDGLTTFAPGQISNDSKDYIENQNDRKDKKNKNDHDVERLKNHAWYYRCDKNKQKEWLGIKTPNLIGDVNYKRVGREWVVATEDHPDHNHRDLKSFGLNSDIEVIKTLDNTKDDVKYSYLDFYCALRDIFVGKNGTDEKWSKVRERWKSVIHEDAVKELINLLSLETTEIRVWGGATNQNSKTSDELSKWRCQTITTIAQKYIPNITVESIIKSGEKVTEMSDEDKRSVNNASPKASRFAKIMIRVKKENVSKLSDSATPSNSSDLEGEMLNTYHEKYLEVTGKNTENGSTNVFENSFAQIVDVDHFVVSPLSGNKYPQRYFNIFKEVSGGTDVTEETYFNKVYQDKMNGFDDIQVISEEIIEEGRTIKYYAVNPEINELENELEDKKNEISNLEECRFSFDKHYDAHDGTIYYIATTNLNGEKTNILKDDTLSSLTLTFIEETNNEEKTGKNVKHELVKEVRKAKNILRKLEFALKKASKHILSDDINTPINEAKEYDNLISVLMHVITDVKEFINEGSEYIDEYKNCVKNRRKKLRKLKREKEKLEEKIEDYYKKIGKKICSYTKKHKQVANAEKELDDAEEKYEKTVKEFIKENKTETDVNNALEEYRKKEENLKKIEEEFENNICASKEEIQVTRYLQEIDSKFIAYNLISLNPKFTNISNEEVIKEFFINNFVSTLDIKKYNNSISDDDIFDLRYFIYDVVNEPITSSEEITLRERLIGLLITEYMFDTEIGYIGSNQNKIYNVFNNNYFDLLFKLFEDTNDNDKFKELLEKDIKIKRNDNSSGETIDSGETLTYNIYKILSSGDTNPYSEETFEEIKKTCSYSYSGMTSDKCWKDVLKNIYTINGLIENELDKISETLVSEASELQKQLDESNRKNSETTQNLLVKNDNAVTSDEEDEETEEGEEEQNIRYEREDEYFQRISEENPILYKKLVDKFKFFDPGFHSISPEGFNARLTFLQQCMRQGHTLETGTSDKPQATAGNLAFGRMPVCVLRIGDFINTRIIIDNISINYDTGQGLAWDLNPEGIGVQPMMAKVGLAIKIIGGQSLEAPISKLQNALSFNYYANTGVYDNRSDRAHTTKELPEGSDTQKYGIKYDFTWSPKNN